jgi:prenyltransferase beta subunit
MNSVMRVSRRVMLRTMAAVGFGGVLSGPLAVRSDAVSANWWDAVTVYLERLSRPDGGYAWEDQNESHLTPTFAVIGGYRVMGRMPPDKGRLAEFVRAHHPSHLKRFEQEHRVFEYQQAQSLVWLDEDPSTLRDAVRAWSRPLEYMKQYERHGYPVFQSEASVFQSRRLLGLPVDELNPAFIEYLDTRRRSNGSFNNTPTADGGDGHIMSTWWGLEALHTLGRADERKAETIQWLRACQRANGGFCYQPEPDFGGVEDVAFTWSAVRALRRLGAEPVQRDACVAWLLSLANEDGGFAGRPGWASNPLTTWYALDALDALDGLDGLDALHTLATLDSTTTQTRTAPARSLPPDLKVFSIQIEAHGEGSPAEAVDLARALRIHLWGAKNSRPGWIERAQFLADRQGVPVRFFVSNEEYGTWVDMPGFGTYSHTSDIIAPAGSEFGPSLADRGVVTWPEFRRDRLDPLWKADGRLIWQFGENEETVWLYIDDSLRRGGYAAISTFHFGNPDFTISEPFLHCYRGQIPYIALQDAHGAEPWWFADMTTGFRTVFLAREPTWQSWLEALRENRVAAIRHDAASRFQTWMHAGSRDVLEFVRHHEPDWRWWDNPAIQRPWVSIVVVGPDDKFEVARPEQGILIRVRCAWQNTTHGLPRTPMAELIRLTVDDVEVLPTLVRVPSPRPRQAPFADHYHHLHLPKPAPGRHAVRAEVRVLATGAHSSRAVQFDA